MSTLFFAPLTRGEGEPRLAGGFVSGFDFGKKSGLSLISLLTTNG
jgi:hypothetical protein